MATTRGFAQAGTRAGTASLPLVPRSNALARYALRALLEEINSERMSMTDPTIQRGDFLDEFGVNLGVGWARSLSEATLREQRLVAGGFPGTIPEARWRVERYLGAELARRKWSPLLPDEISSAVGATYAHARREWLLLARGHTSPATTESIGMVAVSCSGVTGPNDSSESNR